MLLVQDIRPRMVNGGGTVRMSGSGFDGFCEVTVNGRNAPVLDYSDEWLEFSVPPYLGLKNVKLIHAGAECFSSNISVVELSDIETWNLPVRGKDEFRNALLGLMPRGFAWFTGKGGNWWKLFSGFAAGFLDVHETLRRLVDESSPVKTSSFPEWEKELGLPVKGAARDSAEDRLSEIYRVARKPGGCTVPYFKSIALLFGLDVEIYEYWKNPEKFEGIDFGDDDPNFYWMVEQESFEEDWYECTCEDTCEDFLAKWWNEHLEKLMNFIKPSHTKVVYAYVESDIVRMISAEGNYIVTANGNYIVAADGQR